MKSLRIHHRHRVRGNLLRRARVEFPLNLVSSSPEMMHQADVVQLREEWVNHHLHAKTPCSCNRCANHRRTEKGKNKFTIQERRADTNRCRPGAAVVQGSKAYDA